MTTLKTTAGRRIITGLAALIGMALIGFESIPAQAAPHTAYRNYRHRRHTPDRGDIDGDGILNNNDRDMDGDGIPNVRDRDIDGDGIRNNRDRQSSVPANWYRDRYGHWHRGYARRGVVNRPAGRVNPNTYYRNRVLYPQRVHRPVYVNPRARRVGHRIGDEDRDGIRNKRDRDIDGDGVPNWRDRNKDGDRVRNRNDRFPKNPRRR
jgi:hypothetical protein